MIIKYKDINDGNAVKEYNGSLLRLTGADGGVVLMSASALTLTGTNGTVTAGQTLDLSTLLTVPSALASKTVSWSKVSGSDKLTLSGADVTATSGATASDSATFTATVAGISTTVTVTAAEAEPDEPSGGNTMTLTVTYGNGSSDKTQGICFEIRNYAVGDKLSKHDTTQNDYQTTKTWNVDSVTGPAGSGRPSVKIAQSGETWYETNGENINYDEEAYRSASDNGSVGYATLFIHQTSATTNQFKGTYTVTLTW